MPPSNDANPGVNPQKLYRDMVRYVEERGWQREAPGSGWWWHPADFDERILGEAVDEQLTADGVDTREEPS